MVLDKDDESLLAIIQNAIRLLFLRGRDALAVHNFVEVAYSRALDEFHVEQ